MKFRWIVLLLSVLLALPTFAHGDKKHVIGTIEKISPESVIVKTQDGKPVEVKLAATTVYVTNDGKPAKFADVAVGQPVGPYSPPNRNEPIPHPPQISAGRPARNPPPRPNTHTPLATHPPPPRTKRGRP